MFASAFQVTRNFTRPVVISKKVFSGQLASGLATFIVVNKDGWVLTAAHVFADAIKYKEDRVKIEDYRRLETELAANRNKPKAERSKNRIVVPDSDGGWITNFAFWWCNPTARVEVVHIDPLADIALVKLASFNGNTYPCFPRFHKRGSNPSPGQSLCRLGFPFHSIEATFDESTGLFDMKNFTLPPMFPNDGIHTRIQLFSNQGRTRVAKMIETSTPGLKGQSGGPLFDTDGNIWGVQVKTSHLDLGFKPTIEENGKAITIEERQMMHVGLAAHVDHIIDLFEKYSVAFDSV